MDDRLTKIVARLRERFPEVVAQPEAFGEVMAQPKAFSEDSIEVTREGLVDVARFLSEDFELLADWSCIDWLGIEPSERRFQCSAHLASPKHPARLRVSVFIPEGDETCPSLVGVWPGANFQEREIYDFFGIAFDGHPDLRRIFMPDEWEGHPQRKDYPLGGVNVEYHGAFIPPPDVRHQPTTTTGFPERIS